MATTYNGEQEMQQGSELGGNGLNMNELGVEKPDLILLQCPHDPYNHKLMLMVFPNDYDPTKDWYYYNENRISPLNNESIHP
jgi:hypothetical protein